MPSSSAEIIPFANGVAFSSLAPQDINVRFANSKASS